jgi:hypothetical protein
MILKNLPATLASDATSYARTALVSPSVVARAAREALRVISRQPLTWVASE